MLDFLSSLSTLEQNLILFFLVLLLAIVLIFLLYEIFKSPYQFPYFYQEFDVTGKRNIKIEDYIDNFLRKPSNWYVVKNHRHIIAQWKEKSQQHADNCLLKKYRQKQLRVAIDDEYAFKFVAIRKQTRYRQRNYVKSAYKVKVPHSSKSVNWNYLQNRYKQLESIGFEATLSEYKQKSQRNLMTPELREEIKKRDKYTCQKCGRVMADGFGIEIDHIVPVSKGGKSVPSNLQVLCYMCNRQKSNKS